MATTQFSAAPCAIVSGVCTRGTLCSLCRKQCVAQHCWRCDTHQQGLKLCHSCFMANMPMAERLGAGEFQLGFELLAEFACWDQREEAREKAAERKLR